MWTLMFKPWEMCLHVYSCVGLVSVSSITKVTIPNSRARLVHYQAHGLSYQVIQFCNISILFQIQKQAAVSLKMS